MNDAFHLYPSETDVYAAEIEELRHALKLYDTGRWDFDLIDCCFTGKNADLEPWGQQGVEVISTDDEGAKCRAHIGKTFDGTDVCLNVPTNLVGMDDKEYEKYQYRYMGAAHAIVEGCGVRGEWDGDSWWMYETVDFTMPWTFTNAEDGIPNMAATAKAIVDAAEQALEPMENELTLADRMLAQLSGWRDENGEPCQEGDPSPRCSVFFCTE